MGLHEFRRLTFPQRARVVLDEVRGVQRTSETEAICDVVELLADLIEDMAQADEDRDRQEQYEAYRKAQQ